MSSLQSVKDIDQEWRDVVFGYIRSINLLIMVPMEICHICLLFYLPNSSYEHWLRPATGMEIISSDVFNGKVKDVARIKKAFTKGEKWAWVKLNGNVIIDPKRNSRAIAQWTVKVNTKWCQIGIRSNRYFRYWYGAIHWQEKFHKGDEITVQLNLRRGWVSFFKNGKLSYPEYRLNNWLKKHDEKYWLGACVWLNPETLNNDDSVELIDFEVIGHESLSYHTDTKH